MIHFGNNALLPGVWIAAATSLALGNIEIDQAVVSTIAARIAAAKVMLVRMTPTSGSVPPQNFTWHLRCRKECELPHTDRDYFAQAPRRPRTAPSASATPIALPVRRRRAALVPTTFPPARKSGSRGRERPRR